MKTVLKWVGLVFLLLLLYGIGSGVMKLASRPTITQETYDMLTKGMTLEECEELLGTQGVLDGKPVEVPTRYSTPGQLADWALADSVVVIKNFTFTYDEEVFVRLNFQKDKLADKSSPFLKENW